MTLATISVVLPDSQVPFHPLLIVLILCISFFVAQKSKTRTYPPGPRGFWYFGLSKYPFKKPWLTYLEWKEQYGDLIHFTRFGRHYLIINSLEAAHNILERNARFTSDRPSNLPLDKISDWGRFLSMTPYPDDWRQNRKLFHQNFRAEAALQFHDVQKQQVEKFILEILSSKLPLIDQVATLSQRIMFNTVYGLDISTNKDQLPHHARQLLEIADYMLIPGWDGFKNVPFLHMVPSWFPGGYIKTLFQELGQGIDEAIEGPWKLMINSMKSDINHSSLISELISKPDADIKRIKTMGAQALAAASDTTMSAMATFFLAMTLYPHVQIKAQRELDSVLGSGRLPNFDDRSSLPYIEAIYREVMRWHPALPLGLPHITTTDIYYGQYYIPKGTSIYANIWAMTHDLSVNENPDEFIPERHLRKDGCFGPINTILAYGFGRRVCVGRHMANDTIWLAIACILTAVKISNASNLHGNIEGYYTDGSFCSPKSLDCNVSARINLQFLKESKV